MYYFLKGENEAAIVQYQKILDKQPNHSVAHWWIGVSQIADKKYLEAIMSYKKANELLTGDPLYGSFLNYYFWAYLTVMDFENAEKIARKRMDFNMLHGLINLEVLYYTTGEIEKEEEMVNKICAMDSNMHCIGDISYVYAKQGKYEQALEYFKKYEELRDVPDLYGLGELYQKAYLLIKLDRREEAEVILHKEIDHYIERLKLGRALEAGAEFNLAACYALLGDKEKAYDILYKLEEKGFPGDMVSSMQVDPIFENLWDDKELKQIVRRQEKKYADIRAEIARLEADL
jgi:tetratricopeptide (TPR) repeat protein